LLATHSPQRKVLMKLERLFYPACGAIFILLTLAGFQNYIFGGKHADGSPIAPSMLAIVIAHSTAIFAWFLLFFVQSLLISVKNRRLHMRLGWSVLAKATIISVTGPLVATWSIRVDPSQQVFDWPGNQFLFIMYAEITLFVVFVTIGVLNRKRPRVHRPMMLLACLALISGATSRIGLVHSVFGGHHWMGIFAPVIVLGTILLLIRMAVTRTLDREFAAGFAALILGSWIAVSVAETSTWVSVAGSILKY
jgi:hypothetical protein